MRTLIRQSASTERPNGPWCEHDPPCRTWGQHCKKTGNPLDDEWSLVLDVPICDCRRPAWACSCAELEAGAGAEGGGEGLPK